MIRVCRSCAATPAEAPFPPRWRRGAPKICLECGAARPARIERPGRIITRASYRARVRNRAKSGQADLVDMLVSCP